MSFSNATVIILAITDRKMNGLGKFILSSKPITNLFYMFRISELDADTHFYVMSSGTRKEKRDDIYFSKSV
ncbi:hypothetical protein ABD95_13090 [Bacillus paranthracis]|nr:hypothetical protein [Bacillus paranthracis]